MASVPPTKVEFIVGGKYRLVRKIGSGSFGDIYLGINITNGEVRGYISVPSFSGRSRYVLITPFLRDDGPVFCSAAITVHKRIFNISFF